jgi:hypothetical protein
MWEEEEEEEEAEEKRSFERIVGALPAEDEG